MPPLIYHSTQHLDFLFIFVTKPCQRSELTFYFLVTRPRFIMALYSNLKCKRNFNGCFKSGINEQLSAIVPGIWNRSNCFKIVT